jgi:hypothetical protein
MLEHQNLALFYKRDSSIKINIKVLFSSINYRGLFVYYTYK